MEYIREHIANGMKTNDRFLICKIWRSSFNLYPHTIDGVDASSTRFLMDHYLDYLPEDIFEDIIKGDGQLEIIDESQTDTTYDFAYYWIP